MLVTHLPADSRTGRAIDPQLAQAASWSRTDHLLALVFDAVQQLSWQFANIGAQSPSRRPEPLPRPGIEPVRRKGTAVPIEQLKALLPGVESSRVEGNGGGDT